MNRSPLWSRVKPALRATVMLGMFAALSFSANAEARSPNAVLHEKIEADPREDVALALSLDGDLPAAIDTPSGVVPAPDPERSPDKPAPYAPDRAGLDKTRFEPDRDTHKPDTLPYDEPFSPSTAPFKRLSAFDQVDASYTLSVRDQNLRPIGWVKATPPLSSEDVFYADMIVDLAHGKQTRVPSVGPGARILRARAGVGSSDVSVSFSRDGADNWFATTDSRDTRARLVMEIAVPRAALGGEFGDPSWAELASPPYPYAPAAPVSANIARSAAEVTRRIGVSQEMRPRDVVAKLTAYFRAFQDSPEGPAASRDVYLDLALSQKGVCRHRAFAFLVTALALGIPTRMVLNEAHAWVEVYDGRMFRRIDLGGAGRMQRDESSQNVPYDSPEDPFAWPAGASRGQDMQSPRRGGAPGAADPVSRPGDLGPLTPLPNGSSDANGMSTPPPFTDASGHPISRPKSAPSPVPSGTPDTRPPTTVQLTVLDEDAHRGSAFHVRGLLTSDGEPCGATPVILVLVSRTVVVPIATVGTDDKGAFDASLTLGATLAPGEYDVRAYTQGNTKCGAGASQ